MLQDDLFWGSFCNADCPLFVGYSAKMNAYAA